MKLSRAALAAATARSDSVKQLTCEFCKNGAHQLCPRAVANSDRSKIWPCACRADGCGGGSVLRCLTCKNETPGEVSPAMWQCLDPEGCEVRVQKRLARNPGYQQIKEFVMPRATAVAKATPKTKAKAEPRNCADGCGGKTSGGLFLPGHDAKLLSIKVAEVAEGRFTQTAIKSAVQSMRTLGASDKLLDKFSQRVTIAKDRAAKVAEANAAKAAAPKPAAKKAAAKKTSPGKAASKPVSTPAPDVDDDDF